MSTLADFTGWQQHIHTHKFYPFITNKNSSFLLQGPRICGVDPEGSVLIADQVNCCLKTLDKNGVWNCVKIINELPCDAIVTEEGKLIIKSADKMQIFELKTHNGIESGEKVHWVKLNAEFPQRSERKIVLVSMYLRFYSCLYTVRFKLHILLEKTLDKNKVWNCVKMVNELPCDAIVTEEGRLII